MLIFSGRARDTLYRLSVAYSGQEELGIERARDELDDRREHINLSEIFGGSHSQENSCSSGGVFK